MEDSEENIWLVVVYEYIDAVGAYLVCTVWCCIHPFACYGFEAT